MIETFIRNKKGHSYHIFSSQRPEAVMVVPVIGRQLLMVREYAAGIDGDQLYFPRGRAIETDSDIRETARRELLEETSLDLNKANFTTDFQKIYLSPSYSTDYINCMWAVFDENEKSAINVHQLHAEIDEVLLVSQKEFVELAEELLVREAATLYAGCFAINTHIP